MCWCDVLIMNERADGVLVLPCNTEPNHAPWLHGCMLHGCVHRVHVHRVGLWVGLTCQSTAPKLSRVRPLVKGASIVVLYIM